MSNDVLWNDDPIRYLENRVAEKEAKIRELSEALHEERKARRTWRRDDYCAAFLQVFAEIANVIDYGGYELEDRASRIRDTITYIANGDEDGEAAPDRIADYAAWLAGRRAEKPR